MHEPPCRQKTFLSRPHFGFLELHEYHIRRRAGLPTTVGQQDAHVLDRGDQVILDLLAPEPAPARPLEVMVVGCVGKAAFHEMLPATAIPLRGATARLAAGYI